MMDPLSISASIIAVLQLGATVVGYLSNVPGASRDRQNILLEVCSARGILISLKDLGEKVQWTNSWTLTVKSLSIPDGPLDQFKRALERLALKLAPAEGWRKAGRTFAWPFQKEEVKEILSTIGRQKTLFSLALQNDHMYVCKHFNLHANKLTIPLVQWTVSSDPEKCRKCTR